MQPEIAQSSQPRLTLIAKLRHQLRHGLQRRSRALRAGPNSGPDHSVITSCDLGNLFGFELQRLSLDMGELFRAHELLNCLAKLNFC